MFITHILKAAGGAARYGDLVTGGATPSILKRAREAGIITHPHYGTYALPGTSPAVSLAAAYRARLTCVSLCHEQGLPLLAAPRAIHLVVPRDRARRCDDRRPIRGVVLHRDDDLWERAAVQPIAAAIDATAACIDDVGQLALADAALRGTLMSREDILDFALTPSAQRLWLADKADPRAAAITESYVRALLDRAGLNYEPQFEIGPNHHCDLLVEGCVAIEIDGKDTHLNERAFFDDRARDRAVVNAGFVPLRYTYECVFGPRKADILADVEAAKQLLGR